MPVIDDLNAAIQTLSDKEVAMEGRITAHETAEHAVIDGLNAEIAVLQGNPTPTQIAASVTNLQGLAAKLDAVEAASVATPAPTVLPVTEPPVPPVAP